MKATKTASVDLFWGTSTIIVRKEVFRNGWQLGKWKDKIARVAINPMHYQTNASPIASHWITLYDGHVTRYRPTAGDFNLRVWWFVRRHLSRQTIRI